MSDLFYAVTTFLVSMATAFCALFVLKVIFEEKLTAGQSVIFTAVIGFVSWALLLFNYNKNETFRVVCVFLCMFVLMYKMTGRLVKTLFPYITTLAIIAATDSLSVLGFYLLKYSEEVKFIATSVIMLFVTLLSLPIKHTVKALYGNINKKKSTTALMALTMLSILGATYLQVNYELALIGRSNLSDSIIGLFLTTMCVTYMNVIIASSGFIRSLREENENRIVTEQQRVLEEMYDSTRVFRHNYRSTLIVLEGYCKSKDYDKLEERIAELKSEMDDIYANGQLKNVMNISDAGLRNLIMLKIFEAKKYGIETSISISGKSFGCFESMKMLNAVGALLDNAVEAASESRKGMIKLELEDNDVSTSLFIENSFGKKPDLNNIFKKGYSTKSQSGLGLYYVNKIVSNDENTDIIINCSDNMFSVRILSDKKN